MTLNQVKADIKSGKCKAIYICSKSLWWTHDSKDVFDSYVLAMKNYPKVKEYNGNGLNYSPIGEPLIINKDPKQWLKTSERFTKHYGKHRLAALMKAHHQNNSTHFYNKWQKYNDLIDEENKLKIVK